METITITTEFIKLQDLLKLSGLVYTGGEAKDICPTKGDGAGLEIGFNNRYLMEALRYAPADTVRFALNTNISPCVITPTDGSDSFLYMVLPVRLKAQ